MNLENQALENAQQYFDKLSQNRCDDPDNAVQKAVTFHVDDKLTSKCRWRMSKNIQNGVVSF